MYSSAELTARQWLFYGTLRDQAVRELVLPSTTQIRFLETIHLQGFKLFAVKGEVFPIIVYTGEESDWAEGDIFDQVDEHDEARLRYFEGDEYTVKYLTHEGRELCFFEAFSGEYECEGEWVFTEWKQKAEDYREYLERIKIYFSNGTWSGG